MRGERREGGKVRKGGREYVCAVCVILDMHISSCIRTLRSPYTFQLSSAQPLYATRLSHVW